MVEITLSESFIERFKERIPNWGELGWITYKRTYARWIEELGRNEEWYETVKRVVEGNINLDPRLKEEVVPLTVLHELEQEAKDLYEIFFMLLATPPGRGLWMSGTDFQKRTGDALNNCWFIAARPQKYGDSKIVPFYASKEDVLVSMPFSFLFDQSMKGGGVGFSVARKNIVLIPKVARKIDVKVIARKTNKDFEALASVGVIEPFEVGENTVVFTVPDSREGWVEALALVIDAHFERQFSNLQQVIIDVSDVRPLGARIKGFGGVASGAKPLVELINIVNEIINARAKGRLTSVDCTDIFNLIGKAVVAGNVRRTAEIALGDNDDQDFITMKQDQEKLYSHRWASNNSVLTDNAFFDRIDLIEKVAAAIAVNGEPGVANMELARTFGRMIDGYNPDADPEAEGTNPCAEITLANGEPCNLVELFPLVIAKSGFDMKKVIRLVTRYTKRVTFSNYEWEVSRNIITKNRRIGVSMSGIQDWVLNEFDNGVVIGWEDGQLDDGTPIKVPVYNPHVIEALDGMFKAVHEADVEYSAQLGCGLSIKKTTVKPSGTVALLAGVSPGVHWHYSGYQIRRIRFQSTDPLLDVLARCGFFMEPDVYSTNTSVVEFPVMVPTADHKAFKSAGDVSIEEQFASQALIGTYWADNAVSCTITFKEEEKPKIATLLRQYGRIIKNTSLLPYSGHGYAQAPYEPITKERYEEMAAKILAKPQEIYFEDNAKGAELIGGQDCAGGACPIK